jgi:DNA-binding CsgD family transcriptional regulator/pimeloyl-ACP methyl ester carboxylesterase
MDAPPVQYVTTSDGFDIAYSVAGSGPTLLINPRPINDVSLMWKFNPELLGTLTKRCRVVLYDHRGQGLSSRGLKSDTTSETYIRDVEAVMASATGEPFVFWANAFHCEVGIRIAIAHPHLVKGLILQGVRLNTNDQISARLEDLAASEWETFLNLSRTSLYAFGESFPTLEESKHMVTQQDWLTRVQAFKGTKVPEILPRVTVTTMVVASDSVTISAVDDAKKVAALLPRGRLQVIPNDVAVLADVVSRFVEEISTTESYQAAGVQELSTREIEVLRLLTAGRSNQQVADALLISLNTVRRHVSNIFAKTGAANRADAVSHAHRNGIINSD